MRRSDRLDIDTSSQAGLKPEQFLCFASGKIAVIEKNELKPWLNQSWCFPKATADFVWRMEDVLDVYCRPYDPRRPLVCMDEMGKNLVKEKPPSHEAKPGQIKREDYTYEKKGSGNVFLACEPLVGKRYVKVTRRRTKQDWASFMHELLTGPYAQAEKIVLVMDNLNTHSPACLYEILPPHEAKVLADKLEVHSTPKHASWLNIAEIELSALVRPWAGPEYRHDAGTL